MNEFDRMPRVHGMVVDVDELGALTYECRPELCRESGVCCAGYDICVEGEDLARVAEGVELAADYAPGLAGGPPPYRHVFGRLHALETDQEGLCVFAYRDEQGTVLCSIHSAALDRGLEVREVKPRPCLLWPLALSGSEPQYLTVDPGAWRYPCNRRRRFDGRLHETVRRHVAYLFGPAFLADMDAACSDSRPTPRGS